MVRKQNQEQENAKQGAKQNANTPNQNTAQNPPTQNPTQQTSQSAQSSQSSAMQAGGSQGNRQSGLTRREAEVPSLFTVNPYEMMLNPFGFMRRFQDEMDRIFEDFGAVSSGSAGARGGALQRGGFGTGIFSPQVEVFERENNLIVRADLPGINKEDVHIELTDEGLVIEGERRYEHESNESGVHRSERSYGSFRRLIPLPEGINPENATATFKNGVLEVTMQAPQQQQQKRRRLEIQEESPQGEAQGQTSEKSKGQSAGK